LNSIPKGSKPFELIHIDHYGPVDSSRAKKHIFVVVDGLTKFVRLYSAKSTSTREIITALKDYFRAYSRPKCIISDRGSCFTFKDFEEFMEEYNVKHIKIATGSPQANGQVERINRSLGPMIAKLVDQSKVVDKIEHALNNTFNRSIRQLPSKMRFGVEQKGKIVDELKEKLEDINENTKLDSLAQIRKKAATHQKQV